jgi:hypothetical protein
MSFITNLFSGGAGKLVDAIGGVIDNVTTSKEEKMQLENELKKAEMNYALELERLSVAEKKTHLEDIASARQREAKVQTSQYATRLSKNVSPYLALGTVILTFLLFYVLIFKDNIVTDTHKKDILMYVLGVLSAILTQVYSFYFGSSQGSQVKNEIMKDQKK